METGLRNRVGIVTGAGQGIGKAVACALAAEGAWVVVADLNRETGEQAAQELTAMGTKAFSVVADVSRRADVEQMITETRERFGRVDLLVNNAGGHSKYTPVVDLEEEQWDRIVALNLKSVYLCCHAVLPAMIEQRYGRIVNVSSMAARSPSSTPSTDADYAAAKAGVIAFTKHLAREVGPQGITVNAVAPGMTLTPRTQAIWSADYAEKGTRVPLGRVSRPEEQASAILFLLSDAASFITGVTLDTNGGMLMM